MLLVLKAVRALRRQSLNSRHGSFWVQSAPSAGDVAFSRIPLGSCRVLLRSRSRSKVDLSAQLRLPWSTDDNNKAPTPGIRDGWHCFNLAITLGQNWSQDPALNAVTNGGQVSVVVGKNRAVIWVESRKTGQSHTLATRKACFAKSVFRCPYITASPHEPHLFLPPTMALTKRHMFFCLYNSVFQDAKQHKL